MLVGVIGHERVGNQITKNMAKLAKQNENRPCGLAWPIQGGGLGLVFFQNCGKCLGHFIGYHVHIGSASHPRSVMRAFSPNTVAKIRRYAHCESSSIAFPTITFLESPIYQHASQLQRIICTSLYLRFPFPRHNPDLQSRYITRLWCETIRP